MEEGEFGDVVGGGIGSGEECVVFSERCELAFILLVGNGGIGEDTSEDGKRKRLMRIYRFKLIRS